MYFREKYKPLLLSELELEYPKIEEYLNNKIKFIINGSKECGKTTIVKLYLKLLNYEYLFIDNYNEESTVLIETLNNACNNPLCYFNNKKYVVVIDNFDYFDIKFKNSIINSNLPLLIITNSFLKSSIKYIYINNYSNNYINNIYQNICFLENINNNLDFIVFKNINTMFTLLENNNKIIIYNSSLFSYTDYLIEKKLDKKLYMISKLNYIDFQVNLISNINNILTIDKCYDYLLESFKYINHIDYYEILCFLGCGQYVKTTNFKIEHKYKQILKKKTDLWMPKILKK